MQHRVTVLSAIASVTAHAMQNADICTRAEMRDEILSSLPDLDDDQRVFLANVLSDEAEGPTKPALQVITGGRGGAGG